MKIGRDVTELQSDVDFHVLWPKVYLPDLSL